MLEMYKVLTVSGEFSFSLTEMALTMHHFIWSRDLRTSRRMAGMHACNSRLYSGIETTPRYTHIIVSAIGTNEDFY